MAIYHLTAKTGSRGGGQSAGAKDAYIEREGRYAGLKGQKKSDVQAVMCGNMPEWAKDHRDYWKTADRYERANGRLYKEIEFALPKELDPQGREKAAREFAEYLTGKERLPYTLAIHINDPDNPHCHLMISERANDGRPRPPEAWFSRASTEHPERGGAKKSTSLMPKEWLLDAREAWAKIANRHIGDLAEPIDHRTLAAQGIGREPGVHRGVHREARERHRAVQRIETELAVAKLELAEAARQEDGAAESIRAADFNSAAKPAKRLEAMMARSTELAGLLSSEAERIAEPGIRGLERAAAADMKNLAGDKAQAESLLKRLDAEYSRLKNPGLLDRAPLIGGLLRMAGWNSIDNNADWERRYGSAKARYAAVRKAIAGREKKLKDDTEAEKSSAMETAMRQNPDMAEELAGLETRIHDLRWDIQAHTDGVHRGKVKGVSGDNGKAHVTLELDMLGGAFKIAADYEIPQESAPGFVPGHSVEIAAKGGAIELLRDLDIERSRSRDQGMRR